MQFEDLYDGLFGNFCWLGFSVHQYHFEKKSMYAAGT